MYVILNDIVNRFDQFINDIANGFDLNALKDILLYDSANPLLFNTCAFMLMFALLILGYELLKKHRTARMVMVILFSLYFYYKSSAGYCFILLGICISDYFLGKWMYVATSTRTKKLIIVLNVAINIGMLIYFKYFNLLIQTFANITNTHFDVLNIILPAGISFFTFRSISYLVDIYRGEMKACNNFLDYTFYLTFFPPLLAGPVVRAKDMLPQVKGDPIITSHMVSEGIFLIICGLIKKVVVADYLSANFVDRIFENPALYTGFENLMGAIAFTVQLYCDFSGYTDMAIGLALLMGFRFKSNFDAPFKSQSPTEFWHRWHISLSTWLRDYLYIPMGGNRKGSMRKYLNLFLTMLIGGLWHGATWMFAIWGAYHGALLAGHKAITSTSIHKKYAQYTNNRAGIIINITFTFILIVIGFTCFRALSLESLGEMYKAIFTNFHIDIAWQFIQGYTLVFVLIVCALAVHFLPAKYTQKTLGVFHTLPSFYQAILLALVIFLVIQMRNTDLLPFIYFNY